MAGDFFKIRSVALSYRMPEDMLPGQISAMTLRLQARNLWYWTKFEDGPPEGQGYSALSGGWYSSTRWYYGLPQPRVFMFNATVNF
jgi:hypothetical protein